MPIYALLGWMPATLTHRQALMMIAWEEEEWNRPSRTDYYLMALMCTVERGHAKHPNSIQPNQYQLKFTKKELDPKSKEEDAKKQIEYAKAHRLAALGGMARMTVLDKAGNIIKKPDLKPSSGMGKLGQNPLLITKSAAAALTNKSDNANSIRTGDSGNSTNGGDQGPTAGAKRIRTFNPAHRQGRRPK